MFVSASDLRFSHLMSCPYLIYNPLFLLAIHRQVYGDISKLWIHEQELRIKRPSSVEHGRRIGDRVFGCCLVISFDQSRSVCVKIG